MTLHHSTTSKLFGALLACSALLLTAGCGRTTGTEDAGGPPHVLGKEVDRGRPKRSSTVKKAAPRRRTTRTTIRRAPATTTTTTTTTSTTTTTAAPTTAPAVRWRPTAGTTWQVQYSGPTDTTVNAQVYDLDAVDTSATTVAALHAAGRHVVCYISAGSWEDWRPDAAAFPAAVLGSPLDGWAGERWLDVRQTSVLGPIMAARMDQCRAKGFDAVDPDNVDGYTQRTGFSISPAAQLAYNRLLAKLAHDRGLAIGLKNDVEQIPALVDEFDFAVNEECVAYNECGALRPFTSSNKAVFHVEYVGTPAEFCPITRPLGLSSLQKHRKLDAYRLTC